MTDDPALAAVSHRLTQARDQLAGEHMTIPASEIMARDNRRRARRRRAAAGAACAVTGLAVALALAPGRPARPAPGRVQLAAWTVRANPDGTVTFNLNSTSHPAQLQRALAEAGVPAVVRWGEICEAGGPGQPLLDTTGFVTAGSVLARDAASFFASMGGPGRNPNLGWTWTIIPGKIPHDGHFVISAIPGPVPADDFQAVWEFAKTSAPITCATHVSK
jgi:hypothetical protein